MFERIGPVVMLIAVSLSLVMSGFMLGLIVWKAGQKVKLT